MHRISNALSGSARCGQCTVCVALVATRDERRPPVLAALRGDGGGGERREPERVRIDEPDVTRAVGGKESAGTDGGGAGVGGGDATGGAHRDGRELVVRRVDGADVALRPGVH